MPEITATKTVKVQAKTLRLVLKVRDEFAADLVDQDGDSIHSQDDGYVPSFMPGDHFGDYVMLDIDIDTGQIINWKKPDASSIEEWIKNSD